MDYATDIGTAPVNRRMNRSLGGNRSLAADALTVQIHRADVLDVSEHAGEPRIDQKSLRAGDARAQMSRARKHALARNDLQSLDEPTL